MKICFLVHSLLQYIIHAISIQQYKYSTIQQHGLGRDCFLWNEHLNILKRGQISRAKNNAYTNNTCKLGVSAEQALVLDLSLFHSPPHQTAKSGACSHDDRYAQNTQIKTRTYQEDHMSLE